MYIHTDDDGTNNWGNCIRKNVCIERVAAFVFLSPTIRAATPPKEYFMPHCFLYELRNIYHTVFCGRILNHLHLIRLGNK